MPFQSTLCSHIPHTIPPNCHCFLPGSMLYTYICTFFIYQITAGCVADDPMESLYIPVDHLLVHYIPLQESSVKNSPKNVDWKFDQLSGWTHPRLNRGGATFSPDKIHCSWSYGGEEEVDWCSQWIPRIPMPGPVFLSWSSFQLRSTFKTTPCTCME